MRSLTLRHVKIIAMALALCIAQWSLQPRWSSAAESRGGEAATKDAEGAEAKETEKPADPFGRENPRAMLIGLFDALSHDDPARLAAYMEGEQAETPESQARAARLAQALDRNARLSNRISLSLDPQGMLDDGLAPDLEAIGEVDLPSGTTPLLARRSEGTDGESIWQVSRENIEQALATVPESTAPEAEASPVKDRVMLLGAPLSSWALIAGLGLALFIAIVLAARALCRLFGFDEASEGHRSFTEVVMRLVPPVALIAVYSAIDYFAAPMGAGLAERTAIARYSGIVVGLALVWLVWRVVGVIGAAVVTSLQRRGQMQWIGPVRFVTRMIYLALIAYAVATLLATFAIDVTAGLAALGVGGLALALGARKAVEDIVGSVLVLSDKPVRVGDLCRVNGHIGNVLDIGLRSTRIRTLDRTVLAIPNSHFADGEIENLSVRDSFFVDQHFHVAFSEGSRGVMRVLEIARAAIEQDPDHIPGGCPVRFLGFGEFAYRFQIHAHLRCESYAQGFLVQERLLLTMLERLEAEDITVALPSQHIAFEGPKD